MQGRYDNSLCQGIAANADGFAKVGYSLLFSPTLVQKLISGLVLKYRSSAQLLQSRCCASSAVRTEVIAPMKLCGQDAAQDKQP